MINVRNRIAVWAGVLVVAGWGLAVGGCVAGSGGWPVFGAKPPVAASGNEPPPKKEEPPAPPEETVPSPAVEEEPAATIAPLAARVDETFIGPRVHYYDRAAAAWDDLAAAAETLGIEASLPDGWRPCRQEARRLAAAWHDLDIDADPWPLVGDDLDYLQGSCPGLARRVEEVVTGGREEITAAAREDLATVFEHHFADGQYTEAVRAYETLAAADHERAAALRAEYALALRRAGKPRRAAAVIREMIAAAPDTRSSLALRRRYADLLLSLGDTEAARTAYEEMAAFVEEQETHRAWARDQIAIIDTHNAELPGYRRLLAAYYRFNGTALPPELRAAADPAGEAAPAGDDPLRRSRRLLISEAEQRARTWFTSRLDAIDAMVDDRDFLSARKELAALRRAAAPEMLEQLDMMAEHIDQSEALAQSDSREAAAEAGAARWKEAVRAFDNEEYDTAIRLFSALDTGPRAAEAKGYLRRAADRAAAALRRRAATLYARSRRAAGEEERLDLLRQSRSLLEDLIGRYPEAAAVAKARRNMEVIDRELATLTAPPQVDASGP